MNVPSRRELIRWAVIVTPGRAVVEVETAGAAREKAKKERGNTKAIVRPWTG